MSSMKEVAKLAGVSIATVSRVINNTVPVNEDTLVKVKDAIRALNFKPNLLAKGLRIKSGRLIGLVVPEIVHHAFVSLINFIHKNAYEHDFDLILGSNLNNPDVEEYFINNLLRRNVDGIIFSRVSDESRVLRLLDKQNIPIVVIDRALEDERVSSVTVNNSTAGRLAADHLAALGHREIACITGPLNITLCRERLRAFRQRLLEAGIALDERLVCPEDFSFEAGIRAVNGFLSKGARFTGIWAQNDRMAAGVLKCLSQHDLKVPDDVSLIGMDDTDMAALLTPSLTTIKQPFEEMSRTAVDIVLRQIQDRAIPRTHIVLEPSLVIRESTAAKGKE